MSDLIPIETALSELLISVTPVSDIESLYLEQAIGRVLAEVPEAVVDVPPADNSAMDGYAVCSSEVGVSSTMELEVSQRVPAGQAPMPLLSGTAARIFTGAEIPEGADSVIMQENVERTGDRIRLSLPVSKGDNVRKQGQDIQKGQTLLSVGTKLGPSDLGMLASTGIDSVSVYRTIKVAILSTGDELVEPGRVLEPGQIFNSNRFVLHALLSQMGIEVVNIGRVADTPEDTLEALSSAAQQADCIISTGGVSVGEEDHIKSAVESLGALDMWRLKIKPGKPLAFGNVKGVPFFGLPGNPVSALVTFCMIARPYLLALQGADVKPPLSFKVPAGFSRKKSGTRQEFLRSRMEDGTITPFSNQSSGILSSASWANGLAVIPPDLTVKEGDLVDFIPFSELLG